MNLEPETPEAGIAPAPAPATPVRPRTRLWLRLLAWISIPLAGLGGLAYLPGAPQTEEGRTPPTEEHSPPPPSAGGQKTDWAQADKDIAEAIVTARLHAMSLTQKQINEMLNAVSGRVEHNFVPWYVAFGRRKLEELRAYNYYAADRVHFLFTGEERDTGTPALTATFEEQFTAQVLMPDETRASLRQIGRRTAQEFGIRTSRELQRLQETHGVSFAEWRRHLDGLPPLAFTGADGKTVEIGISSLAAPDPIWQEIGATIGGAMVSRFERMPSVVDREHMVTRDGESIFAVGKNAGIYFGSYIVYWVFLIFLIRTGIIPVSIFGALIGWVLWETFAWGSWIGLEYLDYEQTKAQLEPVILERCDAYFAQMRAILTDHSPSGPFKALFQLGR